MDPSSLAARANPRVVAHLPAAFSEEEMALAGVHSEGIRIMSAVCEFAVVRLDAVPYALARRIKDIMLSMGSDAAVAASAWEGEVAETPLVIMGARRHFKALIKALSQADDPAPVLADVLAETFDRYNRRDFSLKLPSGTLPLRDGPPVIMGILNVTPDSFSDGGAFTEADRAVDHALEMAAEGAGIIDVGGESTRPGSAVVPPDEEAARVLPVIEALAKQTHCPVSIDTSKASVARAALDAGAAIVNDVTALAGDPEMAAVCARAGCPLILMHMKGTPRTMQKSPFYRDLMGEITGFLREAVDRAVAAGVDREQIVVDPGIGFGKTVGHNLAILRRLKELSSLGRPIMTGPSRKSFIGKMLDVPVAERVFGTAAAVALSAAAGARIVRVHDVAAMRQAATVASGVAGGVSGGESL